MPYPLMVQEVPHPGSSVDIWWPTEQKFYSGVTSAEFTAEGKLHTKYDIGDECTLDFRGEVWRYSEGGLAFKGVEVDWTNEEDMLLFEGGRAGESSELIGLKIARTKEAVLSRRKTKAYKVFASKIIEIEEDLSARVYASVMEEVVEEIVTEEAIQRLAAAHKQRRRVERERERAIAQSLSLQEPLQTHPFVAELSSDPEDYDAKGNLLRPCGIKGCTFKCSSIDEWRKHKIQAHPTHKSKAEKRKERMLIQQEEEEEEAELLRAQEERREKHLKLLPVKPTEVSEGDSRKLHQKEVWEKESDFEKTPAHLEHPRMTKKGLGLYYSDKKWKIADLKMELQRLGVEYNPRASRDEYIELLVHGEGGALPDRLCLVQVQERRFKREEYLASKEYLEASAKRKRQEEIESEEFGKKMGEVMAASVGGAAVEAVVKPKRSHKKKKKSHKKKGSPENPFVEEFEKPAQFSAKEHEILQNAIDNSKDESGNIKVHTIDFDRLLSENKAAFHPTRTPRRLSNKAYKLKKTDDEISGKRKVGTAAVTRGGFPFASEDDKLSSFVPLNTSGTSAPASRKGLGDAFTGNLKSDFNPTLQNPPYSEAETHLIHRALGIFNLTPDLVTKPRPMNMSATAKNLIDSHPEIFHYNRSVLGLTEKLSSTFKKKFPSYTTNKRIPSPKEPRSAKSKSTSPSRIQIGMEDVYQVSKILDRRKQTSKGKKLKHYEYKIEWVGGDVTWEPKNNINRELLEEYLRGEGLIKNGGGGYLRKKGVAVEGVGTDKIQHALTTSNTTDDLKSGLMTATLSAETSAETATSTSGFLRKKRGAKRRVRKEGSPMSSPVPPPVSSMLEKVPLPSGSLFVSLPVPPEAIERFENQSPPELNDEVSSEEIRELGGERRLQE
eukprot:CAMPEP_0182496366 /NCGR_PEP_ID=MMETSP1321-20130603/5021_1 /TAXON_ID=91990 /ORGANISM="Bolidomonas sp., Strain RCC1657" /LENGTH=891 /DNA_ID=CAMNT_0024699967 /DNA_START=184 /DNA_END=2856 /DNA_ORIENTATION=-